MADENPKTWKRIVAETFCGSCQGSKPEHVVLLEQLLSAAEELKAARLKALLAQCRQMLYEANVREEQPFFESGFLDVLKEAIG